MPDERDSVDWIVLALAFLLVVLAARACA